MNKLCDVEAGKSEEQSGVCTAELEGRRVWEKPVADRRAGCCPMGSSRFLFVFFCGEVTTVEGRHGRTGK